MLAIKNLSFSYIPEHPILEDLTFSVSQGTHLSIMGSSGCGKSTLLRLIYGLLQANRGNLYFEDKELLGPDYHLVPGHPMMKHLVQDFDLMPFISVEENISQYLSVFYPEELQERTLELLNLIDMVSFAKTKVKLLSGGQKQRVALARAIAKEPKIVLLDEPFGHIDNFKKSELRRRLFTYLKKNKITCIVATHDVDDVLPYADELLILKDKKILALDKPKILYKQLNNIHIASLFDEVSALTANGEEILAYPHQLKVVEQAALKVRVTNAFYKGSHYLIESKSGEETVFFNHPQDLQKNSLVYLELMK